MNTQSHFSGIGKVALPDMEKELNCLLSVARPEDAEKLLKIYAPYVQNTAVSFEYSVPSVEEFRQRIEKTLEKYPYIIAERRGEILGYAYASMFKARPAYGWAVETSIYVRGDAHGEGIGRTLYEALEKALKMQNILNANACIVYSETESEVLTKDSMRFHAKMGYRLAGHFSDCGYKFGRWFDMIWMEKHIGEHSDTPKSVKPFPEIREQFEKEIKEKHYEA